MAMTGKFWGLEEAPAVREATERPRKNTMERFNDELSVLERPLEGDIEYYDEAPPPARWRKLGAFVLVAGLTCGGSLFVMRHSSHREAVAPSSATVSAAPAAAAPGASPPSSPTSPASPDPEAHPVLAAAEPTSAAAPSLAPAANDAADSTPVAQQAASVKPTHGSRHSRHSNSGGRHHGHHHHR